MPPNKQGYVNEEYREWSNAAVNVNGRVLTLATKPGVFAHESDDPSAMLLAAHVSARSGDVVVHMNCTNGLLGAALALDGRARHVVLCDRNSLAAEAARRTLFANEVDDPDVRLGHGRMALPEDFRANAVAIRIPPDKQSLLQLLHDAFAILGPEGRCYIAGATNEGIKTAARTMEEIFGNVATIATDAGHRIVRSTRPHKQNAGAAPPPDAFHEQAVELRGRMWTFSSRPGVFSWDHIDEATAILAEHMDVRPADRVLDLGAGYGVLGTLAGAIASEHPVTMLDVDSESVRSAARSAAANGIANARVLASDIAAAVLDEQFDLVVMNPPFHVGKSTDLSVPIQFIYDAWKVLAPGGRLNLVANRTLPYEGAIKYLFRNLTKVHDGRRFKVLSAVKGENILPQAR